MNAYLTIQPFEEGKKIIIIDSKHASGVGYIGTIHTLLDHTKTMADGETAHLCRSRNGHFAWFRESEMRLLSK